MRQSARARVVRRARPDPRVGDPSAPCSVPDRCAQGGGCNATDGARVSGMAAVERSSRKRLRSWRDPDLLDREGRVDSTVAVSFYRLISDQAPRSKSPRDPTNPDLGSTRRRWEQLLLLTRNALRSSTGVVSKKGDLRGHFHNPSALQRRAGPVRPDPPGRESISLSLATDLLDAMVASAANFGAAPTVRAAPARANASRKSVLSLAQSVVSDGSARAHFWAPGVALAPLARRGIIARGGELSWDEADELLSLECVPAPPRARSPTAPKVNNPKRTSTRVWDERPRRC